MEDFIVKARNYYILGKIGEKIGMPSEAATNYFKALAALNDLMLQKVGLKAKDHTDRFNLLRKNYPQLYETADKLFLVYRRTYSEDVSKEELTLLRKKLEGVFQNAAVRLPTEEEIRKKTEEISG